MLRFQYALRLLVACCIVAQPFSAAMASSKTPGKVIAGWVEKITLMETNTLLKAKLDTGAKTSSLHATHIERFKRDGEKWVRFTVDWGEGVEAPVSTLEKRLQRKVRIKSPTNEGDRRLVVELDICFDGRLHRPEFTLTDRSHLIYPVLLGREFLEDVAVVDADATFLTQARCDAVPADKLHIGY